MYELDAAIGLHDGAVHYDVNEHRETASQGAACLALPRRTPRVACLAKLRRRSPKGRSSEFSDFSVGRSCGALQVTLRLRSKPFKDRLEIT
jgi:hypothetical protein